MDNSEKIYKVLFKGVILPGFDKEQVIKNVHNLTKIPVETISRKFFSGKTVVIRHANNKEYAQQLLSRFADIGIQTTIEETISAHSSSSTEDSSYDDFAHYTRPANKNTIVKSFIFVLIILVAILFFFSSNEEIDSQPETVSLKTDVESQNKTLLSEPATNNNISTTHEAKKSDHHTDKLSESVDTSQAPEVSRNIFAENNKESIKIEDSISLTSTEDKAISESILSKELSVTPSPSKVITQKTAQTYNEINGYAYGDSIFDITLDETVSLLKKVHPDYMDYFNRDIVKLLSVENELKEIYTRNEISLYNIGDIFIVTKENKVLSVTLQIDFLFKDSSKLHGSYSLRVLPIIKRKYPLFLSKFINHFNDKDKKWWDKNIENLKENNQAELTHLMDKQHSIIIKYRSNVSNYSNFSLSDYANKQLFNDRLSVTILRN